MTTLHHEIVINAPVGKVWQVLADLEQVQYYNPLVARTHYVSANKEGVGAARHCDFKPKGFSNERVTEWAPNQLIGMEIFESSFPMRYTRWKTYLKKDGFGTRVTQDLEYEVKFGLFGKLLDALLMRKKYDTVLAGIFNGLKSYLEQGK